MRTATPAIKVDGVRRALPSQPDPKHALAWLKKNEVIYSSDVAVATK